MLSYKKIINTEYHEPAPCRDIITKNYDFLPHCNAAPQNCAMITYSKIWHKRENLKNDKDKLEGGPLTKQTRTLSPIIFLSLHHILRLSTLAPRRKAVAWLAMLSVLSTRSSMRSPRERMDSTFWTMMDLTALSSFCADVKASEVPPAVVPGGALLYESMSAPIVGPKVPWREWGMGSGSEVEVLGMEVNFFFFGGCK
jgi:hypothetical protein